MDDIVKKLITEQQDCWASTLENVAKPEDVKAILSNIRMAEELKMLPCKAELERKEIENKAEELAKEYAYKQAELEIKLEQEKIRQRHETFRCVLNNIVKVGLFAGLYSLESAKFDTMIQLEQVSGVTYKNSYRLTDGIHSSLKNLLGK